jgi:hypothetical protein
MTARKKNPKIMEFSVKQAKYSNFGDLGCSILLWWPTVVVSAPRKEQLGSGSWVEVAEAGTDLSCRRPLPQCIAIPSAASNVPPWRRSNLLVWFCSCLKNRLQPGGLAQSYCFLLHTSSSVFLFYFYLYLCLLLALIFFLLASPV